MALSVHTFAGVQVVSVTKALAAAGNYAANDVLSEHASSGTAWTFEDVVKKNGRTATITKAMAIFETTALTPRIVLYLFKAVPTSVLNDNVLNTALLHADLANFVGWIEFDAMETLNAGDSVAISTSGTNGNIPLEFSCATADANLYGIAVTRDAITGEAAGDDLTIVLFVRQD